MAWGYWNTTTDTSVSIDDYVTTGTVWSAWNSPTYSTTSSGTGGRENSAWYYWTDGTANGNEAHQTEAWVTWNEDSYVIVATEEAKPAVHTPPKLSKQERRRIKAKNARDRMTRRKAQKKALQRRGKRAMAEVTAQELLRELIGDEQLKVYQETGRLLVKGRNFDYLIQKGGRTKRLKKNKVIDLCVHINNPYDDKNRVQTLPETDRVIGLALAAKLDESKFNETANIVQTMERKELPKAAVY